MQERSAVCGLFKLPALFLSKESSDLGSFGNAARGTAGTHVGSSWLGWGR